VENVDIKTFVEEAIKSNPELYGGDRANRGLVEKYYLELHGFTIPPHIDTVSASLVREKNRYLKKYPKHDCRVKNKGKLTNASSNPITEILDSFK
jgi:hypothetical protein